MKRVGMIVMAALMMGWVTLNLVTRPDQRTIWYISGLVAGVLIIVIEILAARCSDE
jgi:ammonia channel protein AmtB